MSWVFPGNDKVEGRELVLEWFDGKYYPPDHIRKLATPQINDFPAEASLLIGTEGSLLIPYGYPPKLLPEEKFKHVQPPALAPRNHYHHFVDACLGGEKTESDFIQTGPMNEAILLGTIAIRTPNQELKWDSAGMRFRGNPEANRYLARVYREGWHFGRF